MRRTLAQVTVWGAIAAGLAHTLSAQALGLGEINVESELNQRFSAVIPLSEIDSEDLETVTVSVAPADAYERAGIERADYLDSLEFTIRNDRGQPRVVVSSSQIAREPVVTLLVQARWAGGRILREYTVLLDPPQITKAPAAAPKPAPKPVMEATPAPAPAPVIAAPKPIAPPPKPAPVALPPPPKPEPEFYETRSETRPPVVAKPKPAPSVPPAAASMPAPSTGQFYGPVQAQETLWSIAAKLRPSPMVSMDQVMYALAAANPKTIQRGTTVNKGASLAVPSAETMLALSPAEAKGKLAALRGASAAPKVVKPAAPAAKPAVTPPPPPAPPPAAPSAAPTPTPSKPGKSVLDAPAALTNAPVSKPAPAVKDVPKPAPPVEVKPEPAKVEPKPIVKPEPKPEPKPAPSAEIKPEPKPEPPAQAVVAAPPAPAPAPTVASTEPVAPAPAATAAAPGEAEPAAAVETPPPAAEPAPMVVASPALSQPVPEESGGGLSDLLSTWGLPIGGLLVLLLGGVAVMKRLGARAGKPRSSSKSGGSASKASSFAAGAVGAASSAASRLGDTQVTPARPLDATQSLEQTQAITQQITQRIDADATGEMRPSAFESTLIIEPDVAAGLKSAAQPSAVGQSKTDFDMTTQLQAETMHISLDANDPVSEADFHLAYGLYDEAILLLKQAMAKTPARTDIPVKLAETYFAAGKPLEFQMLAEELKSRIDASEWSKIAIMGAQLCPGVALFSSGGDAAMEADFDLGFDEHEPMPEPMPEPVAAAPAAPPLGMPLSFELPDVSIPSVVEFTPPPAAEPLEILDANIKLQLEPGLVAQPVAEEDPASIDFMLGQSITPLGAASDSGAPALDANLLEFDLDSSLNKPVDNSKPLPGMVDDLDFQLSVSPSPAGSMDDAARDLMLEEFSVSLTPREVAPGTVTDEFNTKLDLARAYVEMGDNEMARGLLQEVQQQGDEKQQREAGEMLQRLPA